MKNTDMNPVFLDRVKLTKLEQGNSQIVKTIALIPSR